MLNQIVINKILDDTGLMQTKMPEKIYNYILPCDIEGCRGNCIELLTAVLTEEQLRYFYKVLVLNWFFGINFMDNKCWGWYQLCKGGEYIELPLLYAPVQTRKQLYYQYRGLAPTPDNIVLIIKDMIYIDVLKMVSRKLSAWLDASILYDQTPLIERANVYGKISSCLNFIRMLDVVFEEEDEDVSDNAEYIGDC